MLREASAKSIEWVNYVQFSKWNHKTIFCGTWETAWLTDYFLKDWAMIPYSLAASFLHDVSSSKAQNEAYHLRYQIRQALYLQGGLLAYCRTWSTIFQNGSYYVLLHVVELCTFIFFLRNKEFTFRREGKN